MKILRFKIVLLFFIILIHTSGSAQEQVEWLTWNEAIERSKVEKRKILIDVYTDWCSNCKKMDRETFANPYVARYLNEYFYPVKLNAQQRQDIFYKDKRYRFVDRGGQLSYHEFAAAIMGGRLKYPTIVFLDEDAKLIQSIPGYRDAFEFELFITYFGEDYHKRIPWSSYKRQQPKASNRTYPQVNVKGN